MSDDMKTQVTDKTELKDNRKRVEVRQQQDNGKREATSAKKESRQHQVRVEDPVGRFNGWRSSRSLSMVEKTDKHRKREQDRKMKVRRFAHRASSGISRTVE